jgi:hypothetical protein
VYILKKDLYINVQVLLIYESSKILEDQMSINWWIGKQIVDYQQKEYYSAIKKK